MGQKQISELEQKLMSFIWEKKKVSVRDVFIHINADRKTAYTTVGTLLTRLEKKGLIVRKALNRVNYYSPRITKPQYIKKISQIFINKIVSSYGEVGIASFVEGIEKLSKKDKEELVRLIEKNVKNK